MSGISGLALVLVYFVVYLVSHGRGRLYVDFTTGTGTPDNPGTPDNTNTGPASPGQLPGLPTLPGIPEVPVFPGAPLPPPVQTP